MTPVYVIVGKSGSGKNFVPECFGLRYVPGNTTRDPRSGDPQDLNYVKKNVLNNFGHFATGVTNFDNNYYWTWISDYNNNLYNYLIVSFEGLQNFYKTVKKTEDELKKINKAKIIQKLEVNSIQSHINENEYINRPFKLIYFKAKLWTRIKNMRKRGDNYKDIIRRILHDRKAFAGAEEYILSRGGTIFIN